MRRKKLGRPRQPTFSTESARRRHPDRCSLRSLDHGNLPSSSNWEGAVSCSRLLVSTIALLVGAGSGLVSADVVDDWRTCAQAHGDAAIAACTQVIEYG